jgi:hypothetical protein
MVGYYYTEKQAAIDAVALVNDYYGCPMDGIETWTTYQEWSDGWAIMADESLVVVLGEPIELPKENEQATT